MTPYYEADGISIYHGDCRDVLAALEPADAIVTDPPYGLEFMGQGWDRGVPGVDFWKRIAEAAKPGAHLLAFGGTRTFHRLTCAIEDAGWEIRDCLMWVYGTGFPKSLDVSKAIDKAAWTQRELVGQNVYAGGHIQNSSQNKLAPPIGTFKRSQDRRDETVPATDAAKQWDGWGTALKPSFEPIILARKPLVGTVAANVLEHGTGALNIDACRIHSGPSSGGSSRKTALGLLNDDGWQPKSQPIDRSMAAGRWPANLIHDGSDEVLELFPETTSGKPSGKRKVAGFATAYEHGTELTGFGDSGSSARFFYCAKASGSDRGNETKGALPLFGVPEETVRNEHPTVKPIALMEWLLRLVVPPGGVVLDPFMGSGSTLVAAKSAGLKAVGIELEESYCALAARRLSC